MRNSGLLYSAMQFLMITALFGLGAVFFGLHYLPQIRANLSEWLLAPSQGFYFLGVFTSGMAVLLTLSFWGMQRHKFVRIQMQSHPFSIEEETIRETVGMFWKESFPDLDAPHEIYVEKKKIEIVTTLPKEGDHKETLEEIEKQLGAFLSNRLGYEKEFLGSLRV